MTNAGLSTLGKKFFLNKYDKDKNGPMDGGLDSNMILYPFEHNPRSPSWCYP